jgi:glycine cleavage system aminomethyltransferase T
MSAAPEPVRRLTVLAADADEIAPGALVYAQGVSAGRVTSAAFSPDLRRALCVAEIPVNAAADALEIGVSGDTGRVGATIRETAESRLAVAFKNSLRSATDSRR